REQEFEFLIVENTPCDLGQERGAGGTLLVALTTIGMLCRLHRGPQAVSIRQPGRGSRGTVLEGSRPHGSLALLLPALTAEVLEHSPLHPSAQRQADPLTLR